MFDINSKKNFFGNSTGEKHINMMISQLKKKINKIKIYLVIAATDTSQIQGISAAGIDAESR